jgi:O-antigen ligase
LIGAGRNTTTQTAHDYLKLMLGVGMAVLVPNLIREWRDVRAFVTVLLAGGAVAALVAIALQRLSVATTTNLLARLRVVGYPTDRIVRYIEDNPDLARRATGTGVDPNSFAGFLMIVLVLAVGQAVARRPAVPRWLPIAAVPLAGVALLLTQSRAALYGAALGVLVLAIMRYRWLFGPLALLGIAVLTFERGSGIVTRFLAGIHGQDAATQLRYREFGNALQLIRDYPVIGVGFGDAPQINLQTGVSSVYLTVAERTGLIGLALFLVLLVVLLARSLRGAFRSVPGDPAGELLLATGAALVAACAAALLDHYFFSLGFPHMAALFWALAGLSEVLLRLAQTAPSPARAGEG